MPDDSAAERRQKYVDGLQFRAVVSSCLIVVLLFVAKLTHLPHSALTNMLSVLLLLVGVNLPYWVAGTRSGFSLRHFYFHWLVDVILISIILYLLGGVDVPYGFLAYVMIVVTSATFLSKRAAFIVASGATVATVSLAIAQVSGFVEPPEIWGFHVTTAQRVAIATFATMFYYIFAYLAGTLADQLKRANTDLSRARVQIENQNKVLEAKVAQRTLQLEERNSEIEEFVHIVTHDLKNVSVGTIETARRLVASEAGHLGERGKRYAQNLVDDTRRMNEMLVHLLRIFRIDREERRAKNVDLARVARDIVDAQASRLEAKRIKVVVGELPTLRVDEAQVRHVLTNLVDNAIKYVGDKATPEIEVSCEARDGEWIVAVRDNGIGISPGQGERIFQLYHRAPNQAVGGVIQEGEGVGLAMSKRMIERWGGKIWVESVAGSGSCFRFSVPRGET